LTLPNPDRAIVDLAKLRDYCLNPLHPQGKLKARVFAAALGLGREDAGWLRARLLEAAHGQAQLVAVTRFGSLYMIEFELRTRAGAAVIRSGWIVRSGELFPRLTTCYVKKDRKQ
jgi:hypothetical protein